MEERLGEMRKGRKERIEKGNHCFFKSSGYDKLELKHKNLVFFKLIECIIQKKICHGVKQDAKICAIGEQNVINEIFILGGQRIDQMRKKGWWRGRRVRIEKGSRERIEIERKETNGVNNLKRRIRNINTCLCLFPQGTTFILSSRLDSAVKRCSSEVLVSSGAAW